MNDALADAYRRFAHVEAEGVSETYFDWAMGVADDPDVLSLIAELPGIKKQPNLIFASARALGAPADGYGAVREWLVRRWPDVESVVRTRSTQTNEAARCAVLLPVLSRLDGELALIEAGASAGLVLYPDQYSYLYDTGEEVVEVHPRSGRSSVLIPCTIDAASVPRHLPNVVVASGSRSQSPRCAQRGRRRVARDARVAGAPLTSRTTPRGGQNSLLAPAASRGGGHPRAHSGARPSGSSRVTRGRFPQCGPRLPHPAAPG